MVGKKHRPTIMLLDGDYTHTAQVAAELSEDLNVFIIGVGANNSSRKSKYYHIKEICPPTYSEGYPRAVKKIIEKHCPDMVLPIGYRSVVALDIIRNEISSDVVLCLPSTFSLEIALDKSKTIAIAKSLGISVPRDYTELVNRMEEEGCISEELHQIPFPIFLKAAKEAGRNIAEKVCSPNKFWKAYDRLKQEAEDGKVLVQEYIDGDNYTYAYGLLFVNNELSLSFGHEELKSVPRQGGSGTRLRIFKNDFLKQVSIDLLKALKWNGVALVEYKRRKDNTYALMEINPKFWASYALASKYGYRFGSTMVANKLGLVQKKKLQRLRGQMVFPLREIAYCLKNRQRESILKGVFSMLWPPARWDINFNDLRVWLPYSWHKILRRLLSSSHRRY